MTFDFAGSGLSEGEYVSLGVHEIDDIDVCVKYVK
jgi:alpha/beta superfamily hydrolase